jgi:hypothetical protein
LLINTFASGKLPKHRLTFSQRDNSVGDRPDLASGCVNLVGKLPGPFMVKSRPLAVAARLCFGRAMNQDVIALVTALLERASEWVRTDLAAKDPAARARAEETLAAMVAAALPGTDGHNRA